MLKLIESMRREYSEVRLGQILGAVVVLMFVVGGSYVAVNGQAWAGVILGGVGISGIVTAFVYGRRKQDRGETKSQEPKTKHARKAARA